jgi:hypothetical protein
MTQVKLCPYKEEEPAIWFRLIEAQFAVAGIKSQQLKYANTLANLPKQVLLDILDSVNACNKSDQPFDDLKVVLLGQFSKSKWQSYFELLYLLLDMQGLEPSIIMGKLVSSDNDLFLAMFLIRLLHSMREVVGSGNHKTAVLMVRAADALWDARHGHDPTVAAATSPCWGKRGDKRASAARSKSHLPSNQDFICFQNPSNGVCNYHNYYNARAYRCVKPCTWLED